MNRFMLCPRKAAEESYQHSRFETARVISGHLDVIDLRGEIMPTQRDAEQELDAAHDAVAIADARAALDQTELEAAHVVGRGDVG